MKLIGNLKNKVDKAQNKEEAGSLILDAGMELTEEELDMVAGGGSSWVNFGDQIPTGDGEIVEIISGKF